MILVTGATGFIGSKIAYALRADELAVRALVRDPSRASPLEGWGCELVQGEMTDAESLRRAVAGCEAVVHLVAIRYGRVEDFERVMMQGTRDLVAAAEDSGVARFVLMSALGTNEDSKDVTPYFRAKWDQEQTVRASALAHTIFRPSFVFGRDGGVLPIFVRQVRWSPVVPVVVPSRRLQPIWAGDVAGFFAKSLSTPAEGRTFELGGADAVTWHELYERIERALGKRRAIVHVPTGLARLGAAVAGRLPRPPLTRDDLTALELTDQTCEMAPAIQAFGIHPIGLDEQLRRAL